MPSTIATDQNHPDNLKLLVAQRKIYSEAKVIRTIRLLIAGLLAVLAPFIVYFQPNWNSILGAIGGTWLLFDQVLLKHIEVTRIKQAATIQEEFDTKLFNLPWNKILVGEKVAPELISVAESSDKSDRTKLENWYPDMTGVPYPLDVLICQRFNLVWDWQLRRQYAGGIFIVITVYILVLIWFAVTQNLLLVDFILGLFLPASSAIADGANTAIEHIRLAGEKEDTAQKLLDMWEQGVRNTASITTNDCREIQNCIYLYRSSGPLVPDWWYRLLREKYEIDMYSTAKQLKTIAQKISLP